MALEYNGIPTRIKPGWGTDIARAALETGEIDLLGIYRHGFDGPLGHDTAITDPVECYNMVKDEDPRKTVWSG